jgi:hypothetical protein
MPLFFIAAFVGVGDHIKGCVFKLHLHGFHICWQLTGEQAAGLKNPGGAFQQNALVNGKVDNDSFR